MKYTLDNKEQTQIETLFRGKEAELDIFKLALDVSAEMFSTFPQVWITMLNHSARIVKRHNKIIKENKLG